MKSKLLRIISAILILASLLSIFAVFAAAETATDGEGETEDELPELEILQNRTYDEGWDLLNGPSMNNAGSLMTFEYETDAQYKNNYFWRFEVQTTANTYLEYNFLNNDRVGAVFEFDIKSDDWSTVPGFLHFGTPGSPSANRNNYSLLTIEDNQLYAYSVPDPNASGASKMAAPFTTLSNSWTHIAIVFDYTYDHDNNPETDENGYFSYSIYFGDTDTYRQTGQLELVVTNVASGKDQANKGCNIIRMGVNGNSPTSCWGSSVCVDNVQTYIYSNQYGQVDLLNDEKGSQINVNYPKTIEIAEGGGIASKGNSDYLNEGYALKIGVDYAYSGKEFHNLKDKNNKSSLRTPILVNKETGEAYGAPFMDDDGVIWVALDPILEHAGYPAYKHDDGIYVDISTGTSSSFISTQTTSATVGGKRVELLSKPSYITDADGNEYLAVNLYDVQTILQDYYVDYDPLGLIVITQSSDPYIIDRDLNLTVMMNIMKDFVFEYATPEEVYDDVEVNTNGFEHPYIHANQDKFDELRAVYLAKPGDPEYDAVLQAYIKRLVNAGESDYKIYARPDANGGYDEYNGLYNMEEQIAYLMTWNWSEDYARRVYRESYGLIQPFYTDELGGSGNGYDLAGGRSNAAGRTTKLMSIAFSYQMTKDVKYLYAMYDIALELGKWKHWGPGHFLNVADATAPFATFFDWTYNGYVELYEQGQTKYDVTVLEEIMWVQGVREGVLSSLNIYTDFLSPPVGTGGSIYPHRDNNWNAVCTSGMLIGALCLLGSDIVDYEYVGSTNGLTERPVEEGGTGYTTVSMQSAWLISSNIKTLMQNGMAQYAPDGDYIESPGYWDYGTSNFFELCSAMQSAAGHTYGMMDCWGIQNTCYFAAHTESSDFKTFNFHDGAVGTQNSEWFMFAGTYFGDTNLSMIRMSHLQNGKGASLFDLFYYPTEELPEANVSFDYYSKHLDLYCARSSWDKGALYVGMMGGINKLGHGQIDAGSFVYHNAGTIWICDLGTEEYNAAGFWPADTRYRYYRMKPEGNNTIALTSDPDNVPYGQDLESTARSIAYESNEHGSYMVLDMTQTMKGNATSWQRGIMLTNDRKTMIVQDEIYFSGVQSAYWFAHYQLTKNDLKQVEIKDNGRTAYMYDYKGNVVRVKIVSSRADIKFEIMDCYTFVHTGDKGTFGPEYSANTPNSAGQKVPEKSRAEFEKLAIKIERTPSVTFAVVFELIDPKTVSRVDSQIDLGYSFTPLTDWTPYADTRDQIVDVEEQEVRKNPIISSIGVNADKIVGYINSGRAYTTELSDLYRALTDIYYVGIRFYYDELGPYKKDYEQFETVYKVEYDAFIGTLNGRVSTSRNLALKLMGI